MTSSEDPPGNFDVVRILFGNVQCLTNKVNELEMTANLEKYSVICLAEHWLNGNNFSLYNLEGYTMATIYLRRNHIHGGAIILISSLLKYHVIDIECYCLEMYFEACAVRLPLCNVIFVSIYRPCDIFLYSLHSLNRCWISSHVITVTLSCVGT